MYCLILWSGAATDFGRYIFGTLGNEATIIMQYYLVPCRLSSDPKMYDLE